MTRLNYSNLPPEAQEAIKKLIGYDPDEISGKTTEQPQTKIDKTSKAKPSRPKQQNLSLPQALVGYLIAVALLLLTLWLLPS